MVPSAVRALMTLVSVAVSTSATTERDELPAGHGEIDAPVEGLPVHHVHEYQADCAAEQKTIRGGEHAEAQALGGKQHDDLSAQHAQMTKHAEFAAARQRGGGTRAGDADEADQHRDSFQRMRDCKGAVEDAHRELLQFVAAAHLERLSIPEGAANERRHGRDIGARTQPDCSL